MDTPTGSADAARDDDAHGDAPSTETPHREETLMEFARASIGMFVSADSRTVRSFRELLRRPGLLTREYMEGRRDLYLNPLELFLLANLIFFVVSGVTHHRMLTTPLSGHTCNGCQPYSAYAQRTVGQKVDALRRESWHNAQGDHAKYRLLLQIAYTRFQTRFDMTSESTARSLVILMVPMFSLFLSLLEYGRGSGVRHLVFSLHFHAFALLMYEALWFIQIGILRPFHIFFDDSVWGPLMLILQALYLVVALGPAYGDGVKARIAKGAIAGVASIAILQIYRFILFLVAFHAA
jgi:hypothetical protein